MDFLHLQNISDDHPAVKILHDLETTSYDRQGCWSAHILRLDTSVFQVILRWADMLNRRLKVGATYCSFTFLKKLSRVLLSLFPMLI